MRRRLLLLPGRLWWHPYWQTVPPAPPPAARSELRQPVRAQRAVRAA
ncbi:hypothetical protein ACF08M_38465 [Streptomyces sp. NPDC015032]